MFLDIAVDVRGLAFPLLEVPLSFVAGLLRAVSAGGGFDGSILGRLAAGAASDSASVAAFVSAASSCASCAEEGLALLGSSSTEFPVSVGAT